MTNHPCSCIILAGGESKRFSGENKAYLTVGTQRMLDRLMAVVQPLFEEIILVTKNPADYLGLDVMIVTDHFNHRSSLSGIHAGLFASGNPHALVVASDMPFIQPPLLELLKATIEPHMDVIIPKTTDGFEPLLAIYSKRCLKSMKAALDKKQFQLPKFLKQMRLKEIDESKLRCRDADLISFFNINSPADLDIADNWLRRPNSE